MFGLAAFRYRNVLTADGGPLEAIESQALWVGGMPMVQCNARLSPGLTAPGKSSLSGDAHGTGTHRIASVARQQAVSEALKRWAFEAVVQSSRAEEFAFDVDPSSTGMAAAPGLTGRKSRRSAMLGAVERFSLSAWWEGRGRWRLFETDWPGVSAVVIDGPFGGVTVIAFSRTNFGLFAYGVAAEESFGAACERAIVAMARHERKLYAWWLSLVTGEKFTPTDRFERRSLFFATEEGHALFQRRLQAGAQSAMPAASLICDREIPGPWAEYTTVWRFALKPTSDGFLRSGDDYFFW